MLDVPIPTVEQQSPFRLLGTGIDVKPLLAQLDAHPELWNQHSMRRVAPDSPHTQMSDIWVRYNDFRPYRDRGDFTGINDRHVPIWYPSWYVLTALQPIVRSMAAHFQAEMIGGVLITRIPPGGRIEPHTDHGWHVEYYDKFYLSLRSPPGAIFATPEQVINPLPGELWLFDNRVKHWVENRHATEERITLIVCLRTPMFGRMP
jgi:hypothetical protein